jgi:Zn-dependent protease
MTDLPPEQGSPKPAPDPSPFEGWDEELYARTSAVLAAPDQPGSRTRAWFWLLLTLGLFALSFVRVFEWRSLALIVGVLLLHESGHFLGMRLFGYRNVRMFFIPFFGAAVSGTKHAAPVWQQGVVLLLGPLPGILLGVVLALTLQPARGTLLGQLVQWLVIVNALNLLPLVPLDGGRLLDVLLFARRPALAAGFGVFAVLGVAGLAWRAGSWFLGLVAGLVLLGVPWRYKKALQERAFADNPQQMPGRLEDLDDGQRRELFGWALLLNPVDRSPANLAEAMRSLHEHMVSRRPAPWVFVGLLLLYLGGFAGSAAALLQPARAERRQYEAALALAEDSAPALDEVLRLRRAARKARAEKARELKAESEAKWAEVVGAWREQPAGVRARALQRLYAGWAREDGLRKLLLARLQTALEAQAGIVVSGGPRAA